MRIIIVGAGKTAEIIIQYLEKSRHDVIVIDKNKDVIDSITNRYSVNGVCGSGASRSVLNQAGASTADALISLTPIDEINLLACSMAKSAGTRYTVAEVEREELVKDKAFLLDKFGIDYLLTPKELVASAITDQIYFNSANRVEPFLEGNILLAEIIVDRNSLFSEKKLGEVKPLLKLDFLVFGVLRGEKVLVPKGDFVLQPGDTIGLIAKKEEMTKLFLRTDLIRKPVRSVLLTGGNQLGTVLAERLSNNGIHVKLVENDRERCERLLSELNKVKVIYGSGSDAELLAEEGIGKCDACICATDSDETNLLTSLIAWTNGVDNTITTIHSTSYENILRKVTLNITLSPERVVAEKLLGYVLKLEKRKGEDSGRYYSFGSELLEINSFNVPVGFTRADTPLMNSKMRLKKGVIIGAIEREGNIIIPNGMDMLRVGDQVIILSENHSEIDSLMDIFM